MPTRSAFSPETWLRHHHQRIEAAIGGPIELITVVPSSRNVTAAPAYSPLLWLVKSLRLDRRIPVKPVAYFTRQIAKHTSLVPDAVGITDHVQGRRILLIEDAWISGAQALSTAIAIRRAGARSIALVPIARVVDTTPLPSDYEAAATSPPDLKRWPHRYVTSHSQASRRTP